MTPDGEAQRPSRKAELRAAAIKVSAAAVIAAGLFALYAHEVRVEQQVTDLLAGTKVLGGRAGGARAELNKDTPRGWLSAEDQLKKALDLQPSNPYAVAAYADVQVMLSSAGFSDRAQRADEAVTRADGKDVALPERFEARALLMISSGRPGEAEAYLAGLLEKYGAVPRLVDVLGRAQRASGKLEAARQSFKRAQDADWRSPRYLADYAQALLEDGNALEAAQAFERALQANSDHTRAQLGKARALVALARLGRGGGDLKAALALCDAVLAKPSEELPAALKAKALAARSEAKLAFGDVPGAGQDAAAAVQVDGKSAAGLRARALVLASARNSDAASALESAIAADPYDAATWFDGATALAAAGDTAGAEKILGAATAALPKSARFPEVYRQMGALYLESHDVEAALKTFNEALARYKAARTPPPVMEAFYADVVAQVSRAGKKTLAEAWVKEARALHH